MKSSMSTDIFASLAWSNPGTRPVLFIGERSIRELDGAPNVIDVEAGKDDCGISLANVIVSFSWDPVGGGSWTLVFISIRMYRCGSRQTQSNIYIIKVKNSKAEGKNKKQKTKLFL